MIESMLRGSRYLVLAAVFGAVAAAFALFTYGFVRTMMIVWQTFASADLSSKGGKLLMVAFIEVFDLLRGAGKVVAKKLGHRRAAVGGRRRSGRRIVRACRTQALSRRRVLGL